MSATMHLDTDELNAETDAELAGPCHRAVSVHTVHDEIVRLRRLVSTTPEQRYHAARRARERLAQASARQSSLFGGDP